MLCCLCLFGGKCASAWLNTYTTGNRCLAAEDGGIASPPNSRTSSNAGWLFMPGRVSPILLQVSSCLQDQVRWLVTADHEEGCRKYHINFNSYSKCCLYAKSTPSPSHCLLLHVFCSLPLLRRTLWMASYLLQHLNSSSRRS